MMDRPLLALTRRAPDADAAPDPAATANMRQLIQLRWLAVAGQLGTVLFVHFGLGVPLRLGAMLAVVAALAAANVAGTWLLPRHRVTNVEITLALLFDMGSLTAQLYLSGGAENPFIALFLLQVVLGAILLELWSVWLIVGVACLCYAGLSVGGRPLGYPAGLDVAALQRVGAWISFALTGGLLAGFIARITRNLRARDSYLAELRRRAAEEDGIVRMGLFASGAAHELGTPLASIAVILGDWRRVPTIGRDPELASEVEVMQAEVARCKAIVSDILHSAGEPREEAMASVCAADVLDEAAAQWRPTHAGVPLGLRCEGLDGVTLVADASLRQAIWSLLDNAAEASPVGIAMTATMHAEGIAVVVADRGPGFSAAQLAAVGKPFRSSKGEGHGLGLFLASNVARRLGGRLEAANRAGGGAEVRLVLPVAGAGG